MQWMHALSPASVPEILLFDPVNFVLAMLLLPPPHRPLVEAIRDGEVRVTQQQHEQIED